jgi:hypothetical protein
MNLKITSDLWGLIDSTQNVARGIPTKNNGNFLFFFGLFIIERFWTFALATNKNKYHKM